MTTWLIDPRRPNGHAGVFRADDTEQGAQVVAAMRAVFGTERIHPLEPKEVPPCTS